MAPLLAGIAATLAAYSIGVTAASQSYQLVDSYRPGNFWDKFNFITDADPNGGFVNYVDRQAAQAAGLIKTSESSVTLGVDSSATLSTTGYGLFVGTFTHFPKPVCGSWPAFWMFSEGTRGEFDIYEMWNDVSANQITYHTSAGYSSCKMSNPVDHQNPLIATSCYSDVNIGCGVQEKDGQWGSSSGGTYALQWTENEVNIWSWPIGAEPSDLKASNPDPSTWPTPHAQLLSSDCDIAGAFGEMSIRLNIDFCSTAGINGIWDSCAASTGTTCVNYIAHNPAALESVYFEIASIDIYQLHETPSTSTGVLPPPPTSTSSVQPGATSSYSFSGNYSRSLSEVPMTTSTVYNTLVYTVTSCAATVTDCPARLGQVTTELVSAYTTVCPIKDISSISVGGSGETTSTAKPVTISSIRASRTGTGAAVVSTHASPAVVTTNSGMHLGASSTMMLLGFILFAL